MSSGSNIGGTRYHADSRPACPRLRGDGSGCAAARRSWTVRPAAGVTGPLVAGVVAGYGVALPVGAVATYLVGLGARERFRTAAVLLLASRPQTRSSHLLPRSVVPASRRFCVMWPRR